MIALADPDGVLRYVSSSAEAVTGLSAQHWTGLTFEDVLARHLPGMGEMRQVVRRLLPGDSSTWEGELDRDGAGPRTIRVTVVNHVDTPEVAGWVITARDVTDEVRAQRQVGQGHLDHEPSRAVSRTATASPCAGRSSAADRAATCGPTSRSASAE